VAPLCATSVGAPLAIPYFSAHLNCPNQPAQQGFSSWCPPAPLPCPFPRTPLLKLMPTSRNAGVTLCCEGRLAKKGGADRPASINCKHARRGRSAAPPAPLALATVTRTPTQTIQAPNCAPGAWEEAQRGTCGSGVPCLSAPFAKPRPLAEPPQTAFPSQHDLMTRRRDSTLNGLAQKRRNFLYNSEI